MGVVVAVPHPNYGRGFVLEPPLLLLLEITTDCSKSKYALKTVVDKFISSFGASLYIWNLLLSHVLWLVIEGP